MGSLKENRFCEKEVCNISFNEADSRAAIPKLVLESKSPAQVRWSFRKGVRHFQAEHCRNSLPATGRAHYLYASRTNQLHSQFTVV